MILNLIKLTNKTNGQASYFAVNDKHYDAMLACGGCWELEKDYCWSCVGEVRISEEILSEQGYFYKENEIGN